MPQSDPGTMDIEAVCALREQRLGWADKGIPPELWGRTVAEAAALRLPLSRFPTPLLTLSAAGLRHNIDTMAAWCAERVGEAQGGE